MSRLVILLFILWSFNGCTQTLPMKDSVFQMMDKVYISPELKPHVKHYLEEMMAQGVNVYGIGLLDSIIVVPDSAKVCESYDAIGCSFGGSVKVKKGRGYYTNPQLYWRLMMYHELGHAILKLPHSNFYFHIMYPSILEDIEIYEANWVLFLKAYVEYQRFCSSNNYLLD